MHPPEIQYLSHPWAEVLDLAGRELVALVGAGGKTSLLLTLGQELALAGQRVIVSTTTKIYRPAEGDRLILEPDPDRLAARLAGRPLPGEAVFLGRGLEETPTGTKLLGLAPETVDRLFLEGRAEYVLVEADGARGRPLKAPRLDEPVIPAETTVVVGVAGLSALGRPVARENIHGLAEFLALVQVQEGQALTPLHLARLIGHPQGLFKAAPAEARRVILLNQADDEAARRLGREVAQELGKLRQGGRAVVNSFVTGQREVYDLAE